MPCRATHPVQREKLLAPFWENPALFKQDDGTVNIMDLLGELGKHLDFCPTIALRVGEDIRKVPEFSDECASGGRARSTKVRL